MGISDRDYMRAPSARNGRLQAYEKAARKLEYGNWPERRKRWVRRTAYVLVAILVLLWGSARWLD